MKQNLTKEVQFNTKITPITRAKLEAVCSHTGWTIKQAIERSINRMHIGLPTEKQAKK